MLKSSIELPQYLSPRFAKLSSNLIARPFWVNVSWLLLLVAVMAYQTYLALNYHSNETTNTALVIGRIAAYNLLVLMVLLWLPVMRHAMSRLRYWGVVRWFPLDSVKHIHRWLGHGLFFAAMLHGASYLVYFDSLEGDLLPIIWGQEADLVRSMETTMYEFVTEDESIADVRDWVSSGWNQKTYHEIIAPLMKEDCTKCHSSGSTMTYAVPDLPLTDFESVKSLSQKGFASRQFRINMAGILMWVFFAAIWFTSLAFMRAKKYHWFQHVHRLGYVIAVLALLHIPRFEYCVLPALLLLLEYYLNRKTKKWYGCRAKIRPVGSRTLSMEIILPEPVFIKSGHFVQIRIKELSKREWHSISTMNGGQCSNTVKLLIKSLGDWTEKLYRLTAGGNEIEVDIRGFYASPMASAESQCQVLCVAGGIGVTPILSLVNEFIPRPDISIKKSMEVVWVFQDWYLLEILVDEIQSSQDVGVIWHLFATTCRPAGVLIPECIQVSNRRPCIGAQVKQFELGREAQKHAFVCGPKSLSEAVKVEVIKRSGWRVSVEHF